MEELTARLEVAAIPQDLKLELRTLAQELERLRPRLSAAQARRSRRRLAQVVGEATEPMTDTHWWPVSLDLIAKAAQECGPAGNGVAEVTQRLVPMLWTQLGPYAEVRLQEITEGTVWGICELTDTLTEPRRSFVAPNAISLAQGHFHKHAWFRAVYAGKAPVGFVMIVDDDETPEYFLWRFMVAEPCQGRGYARQAIQRLVEYVRTRPAARELLVSCGEGEGSPKEFYLKQGFVPTGEVVGEETVLRLALS